MKILTQQLGWLIIFQYVRRGRQWVDRPDGDDQDSQVNLLHDGAQAGSNLFLLFLFDFLLLQSFSSFSEMTKLSQSTWW